jgi:hypothetical protein
VNPLIDLARELAARGVQAGQLEGETFLPVAANLVVGLRDGAYRWLEGAHLRSHPASDAAGAAERIAAQRARLIARTPRRGAHASGPPLDARPR